MFHIECASSADWLEIAHLHALSWQETYKGILEDNFLKNEVMEDRIALWKSRFLEPIEKNMTFVARSNGVIVGFICIIPSSHDLFGHLIDNLHVNKKHQGVGIGISLLFFAMQWLSGIKPAMSVYLKVFAENHSALSFYERLEGECVSAHEWLSPNLQHVPELVYIWESALSFKEKLEKRISSIQFDNLEKSNVEDA